MIFAVAVRDELTASTGCDRIDLPTMVPTTVSPLTPAQVHALAEAVNPRYRAVVPVGEGTGPGRPELLGRTVDRVDFPRRIVTVDRQLASDWRQRAA